MITNEISFRDNSFRHSKKVADFLIALFEELNSRGVRYCVLNPHERLPHYTPSDVDMAVASEDFKKAESIIFNIAAALSFRVIQKLYYDVSHCFFYVIAFRDYSGRLGFVQLDLLNDDVGIGKYLLNTKTILTGRRQLNGFWIPSIQVEACYLLIKKVTKGVLLPEHEKKLRDLLGDDPNEAEKLFKNVFGSNKIEIIRELIAGQEAEQNKFLIEILKKTLFMRYTILKPKRLFFKCLWLPKRIFKRLFEPTGLIIVFVSPDGGGKSTLADCILNRMHFAFRNSKKIHWRPYLLPPPRRLLTPHMWNQPEAPNYHPHNHSLNGKLNSIFRFFYYFMDFILGFVPKILWPKIRTHLVVIERYYYDFLIDTKRYRLNIPHLLPRTFMRVIPKPDLLFLLSGPPEVIYSRKQEICIDEINRQLNAIKEIGEKITNSHTVSIDQLLEKEIQQVEEIILDTLQKRLQKRVSRCKWIRE